MALIIKLLLLLSKTCLTFCFYTGHNYIGTEHLLLGLLREGEGVAARVLENLGADPSNIKTQASIVTSSLYCLVSDILLESEGRCI